MKNDNRLVALLDEAEKNDDELLKLSLRLPILSPSSSSDVTYEKENLQVPVFNNVLDSIPESQIYGNEFYLFFQSWNSNTNDQAMNFEEEDGGESKGLDLSLSLRHGGTPPSPNRSSPPQPSPQPNYHCSSPPQSSPQPNYPMPVVPVSSIIPPGIPTSSNTGSSPPLSSPQPNYPMPVVPVSSIIPPGIPTSSNTGSSPPLPLPLPLPQPNYPMPTVDPVVGSSYGIYRPNKARRNPFQKPKRGKSETVDIPYPWATNERAKIHSLHYLLSNGISEITGYIECRECQETFAIGFKLEEKINEIRDYVSANKSCLNKRAPTGWMNPQLYNCKSCGSELKPVSTKKRQINWLFLLLGNMLGCCKLSELKYFCKHNKYHRTGAKNRLLFSTYIGLCKHLEPNNQSFDIDLD